MLESTAEPQSHGVGRDSHSIRFQHFRIARVHQIINVHMWNRFAAARADIESRHGRSPPISPPWSTSTFHLPDGHLSLSTKAREALLFHGLTAPIEAISVQGLDVRLSGSDGMAGRAVYLADKSSKADQYAGDRRHGLIIIARVLLGNTHIRLAAERTLTRPPTLTPDSHLLFDSVMLESQRNHQAAQLMRFREFAIYDNAQIYPLFAVEYERV
jgi:hypothetical protein